MNKNIKDLGKMLLKKKIYIILITIILAITGLAYMVTNVEYVAMQKILLGTSEDMALMETYKELVKSSTILEKVKNNIVLDMTVSKLADSLEVDSVENTNLIAIKVHSEEPEMAENIAKEITNVFLQTVDEIYEKSDLYQVDFNMDYDNNGDIVAVTILSGFAGFVLSSLFFAICFLFDTKIKSCKEIEEITGLKSLISIPMIKSIVKKRLNIKTIKAHKSEVFKTLMTNIQFLSSNHIQSKTLLITSSMPLEGKTYVATNLAIEFAKAGKKVILIDGDMRKGRQAKIFNLPNNLGFSNYLADIDSNGNVIHERITRFIHDTEIRNLNVITSGCVPPNPTELLKTNKINELIKDLKVFYDVIIFDGVSILESQETTILAKICDLTLLLSSYGNTKKEDLKHSYEQISNSEQSVIGVALNKIPDRKLKKKLIVLKNTFQQYLYQFEKKINILFKKIKKITKVWNRFVNFLKVVLGIMILVFLKIKGFMIRSMNEIKDKSQSVKDYIEKYKQKKEKIKLIEAGSMILEEEENNIIKDVFENEIAKLESADEAQYKKKLDELKVNIDEKSKNEEVQQELMKTKPIVSKRQEKSKFDLIREQQEKEVKTVEEIGQQQKIKIDESEKQEENITMEQQEIEELKERQRIEREKKEEEKRKREEKIESYEEIDLGQQEQITEEMIRRQVEMDDMIRMSEMEEEEEKLKEKTEKRKKRRQIWIQFKEERMEQFQNVIDSIKAMQEQYKMKNSQKNVILEEERIRKNEAKIEERIKKENLRIENKARIAHEKQEKREYREMEKQKHREELRIREELQEDNLYPKPRM